MAVPRRIVGGSYFAASLAFDAITMNILRNPTRIRNVNLGAIHRAGEL
jgi:hypothetical protein